MSKKLRVKMVDVIEGNLYKKWAEDDYIYVYDLVVQVVGVDYKYYVHKHVFYGCFVDDEGFYHPDYNAKKDAHKLMNRILAKGEIDTKHWNCVGDVPDKDNFDERLQEAWSDISDHFEY